MSFLRVQMVQRGKTFKDFAIEIEKKVTLMQRGVEFLGDASANQMKYFIKASILRQPSTGALADSITVHKLSDVVGVGRIPDLVPYWGVMNFGATIDGKRFVPGGGKLVKGDFGGDAPDSKYQGTPGGAGVRLNTPGKFGIKATLTVEPKNYIEKTINWLQSNWINHLKSSGV